MAVAQIAREFGCSGRTIRNIANSAGIALPRQRRTAPKSEMLADEHWLTAALRDGKSPGRIADELGVQHGDVVAAMEQAGIDDPRSKRFAQLYEPGWLQHAFDEHRSVKSIARQIGCSPTAVRTAIRQLGIDRPPASLPYPQLGDETWLRDRYVGRRLSAADFAAELGCDPKTVTKAIRRAGIAPHGARRRSAPPAQQLRADWEESSRVSVVAARHRTSFALAEVWLAEIGVYASEVSAVPAETLRSLVADGATISAIARRFNIDRRRVRVELVRQGLGGEPEDRDRPPKLDA